MRNSLRFKRMHAATLCVLVAGSSALIHAQAAPDEAHAYVLGPTGVAIEFTACQTSDEPNCYLDFSVYRNPPGYTKSAVWASSINADQASHTIYDTGVKASQTYTYQVCAGGYANASRSNCVQTNSVTTPKASTTPPSKPPGASGSGSSNDGKSSFAPPSNLMATATTTATYLKWTNPPHDTLPTTITILRQLPGATSFASLKELDWKQTAYTDAGPLSPHQSYEYSVCEGSPAPLMNNCVDSKTLVTWGADPILTATRVSPTTVRLSVAIDNLYTLFAISVTRQGSDDPCRQGTTLGNGEQGCRTQSVGVNGSPINAPVNVTIYQHSGDWGSNSSSAPWIVDIPDDTTVKAGVEYYYIAHVTWIGPLSQDSAVATAPATRMLKSPIRVKSLASQKYKPIHPAPTPRAPVKALPRVSSTSVLNSAMTPAQQKPDDAQSLYSLGQVYCEHRSRNTCVSLMYMGLLQANKAGNTELAGRIRQSLTDQGVSVSRSP